MLSFVMLSIVFSYWYTERLYAKFCDAKRHIFYCYAEFCYAEVFIYYCYSEPLHFLIAMLNIFMFSFVMLSNFLVTVLSFVMLSFVMVSVSISYCYAECLYAEFCHAECPIF
jgi:hypothetical protein